MKRAMLIAALVGLIAVPSGASSQQRRVNQNAATIKDFLKRVDTYVALHKKLEATIPSLPKEATPQQVDAHERALGKLIQQARAGAKPGDLFTPAMQTFVRSVLQPIFTGKAGRQIKDEITDKEYKGSVKLTVNGRYPDEVPVSTMPPQVLEALPKLPEELEYRFILHSLILFDPHAHTIADFMQRAFK
jgi:hypothetical protein